MRIVYVTASLPHGPYESFLLPEITSLRRLGHELLIVPTIPQGSIVHRSARPLEDATVARRLHSAGVLTAAIGQLTRKPVASMRAISRIGSIRQVKASLRSLAVVPKGLWLGRLTARWGADHIHAHWATAPASVASIAAAVSGIPWSLTAHRYDIRADDFLEAKLRCAAFTRFVSRSGLELALSTVGDAGRDPFVLHLGVEVPDPAADPPARVAEPATPTLLCAARLVPVKGHEHLLEALSILGRHGIRPTLLLAGDGRLRNRLEHLCAAKGLDRQVRFLGQLTHEETLGLYRRGITAAVLASVELGPGEHEGIPVSLLEAMARGVPVVATATGGIPEAVHDGTGLLVPAGDPRALAGALGDVLTDAGLRERLGHAARERIRTDFDVVSITPRLVERLETAASP